MSEFFDVLPSLGLIALLIVGVVGGIGLLARTTHRNTRKTPLP